jgi:hypothetical protein
MEVVAGAALDGVAAVSVVLSPSPNVFANAHTFRMPSMTAGAFVVFSSATWLVCSKLNKVLIKLRNTQQNLTYQSTHCR